MGYSITGGPEVLELLERPVPEPGPGEVRIRVAVSGLNPTDCKSRRGLGLAAGNEFELMVPHQDGAGTVDAVGGGVDPSRVGERVWIWEAAWQRTEGTAQEYVVLPEHQAVHLPDGATFELGASLGIPALTAHRCLTVGAEGPINLRPGALHGRTVLVAGGAGAVGHAAIELAGWAGASVIATVSSAEKARMSAAAGAAVVNYRESDPVAAIRSLAPDGVDLVIEVAPAANASLDRAVVGPSATIAVFNHDGELRLLPYAYMGLNTRYQFVLVYTVPAEAKTGAVRDVTAAVAAGAMGVGEEAGLRLHRFRLEQTQAAHAAVEANLVGKALIDLGPA